MLTRFIFFVLLLALVRPARAQTIRAAAAPTLPPEEVTAEARSNWQRRADAWLAPLDKTPLTSAAGTGVLYDRVAALAGFPIYGHRLYDKAGTFQY